MAAIVILAFLHMVNLRNFIKFATVMHLYLWYTNSKNPDTVAYSVLSKLWGFFVLFSYLTFFAPCICGYTLQWFNFPRCIHLSHLFVKDAKWAQVCMDLFFVFSVFALLRIASVALFIVWRWWLQEKLKYRR